MKELLDHGANVECTDGATKRTPLLLAADSSNIYMRISELLTGYQWNHVGNQGEDSPFQSQKYDFFQLMVKKLSTMWIFTPIILGTEYSS
jgi:hypothetical protein